MKLLSYQPHRKIYYPAGLISLVMLPALCIWWLHQHKAFGPLRAMDIVFLDSITNSAFQPEYRMPAKKKYLVLELTGNDADDSISLSYAQLMLKRWKAAKDDTQAIDIHFGKKAKYWTLIEAVNKVKAIGLNIYVPYQDHFYAFWNFHPIKEKNTVPLLPCAGVFFVERPVEDSWLDKIIIFGKKVLPDYWPAAILFVVMSVSAVIQLRRRKLLHAY